MYSQKTIQTLNPMWYINLPKKEKNEIQFLLKQTKKDMWDKKPTLLKSGTILTANKSTASITKGSKYRLMNHFCTLVSTIYDTNWHQFVTIKNNSGWTVKMNLNNFDVQ